MSVIMTHNFRFFQLIGPIFPCFLALEVSFIKKKSDTKKNKNVLQPYMQHPFGAFVAIIAEDKVDTQRQLASHCE